MCGKEISESCSITHTWKCAWNLSTLSTSKFGWLRNCQEITSVFVAQNIAKFRWHIKIFIQFRLVPNTVKLHPKGIRQRPFIIVSRYKTWHFAKVWWSMKIFSNWILTDGPFSFRYTLVMKNRCYYNHPVKLWLNTMHCY